MSRYMERVETLPRMEALSRMPWHLPLMRVLRRLRQVNLQMEASLDYVSKTLSRREKKVSALEKGQVSNAEASGNTWN